MMANVINCNPVDTFANALMRPPVNYSDRNPKLTQQKQQQVMKGLLA